MEKRVFRYFFDFTDGQKKWLNRMADRGYRLKSCGKVMYVFEHCNSGEYEYSVEFVGDRDFARANDYRKYLEDMGFRTFTKAININFSKGKIRWRPYQKGSTKFAYSSGGFNKEMLILEKKKDGTSFELHTDFKDKMHIFDTLKGVYAYVAVLMCALVAMTFFSEVSELQSVTLWILRFILSIPACFFAVNSVKFYLRARKMQKESEIYEH